jgi:hypothetical protein
MNKQKKLEQRKNQLPGLDNLPFSFWEGGEETGTWGDVVDEFISSLIDETEKQAQKEMREDLIKWIHESEMDGVEINSVLTYLNKIK